LKKEERNEKSTLQNQTFKASIGAVSYTKQYSNLKYNVYFAFNDELSFSTDQCNTLKGYERVGNYCKKSYNVISKITDVPNSSVEYYKSEWTSNYNKTIEVGTSKYDLYENVYLDIDQVPDFDLTCSFTSEVGSDKQLYLNANNNAPTAALGYYGWSSTYEGENSTSRLLAVGSYTYYIKDKFNSKNSCSIDVQKSTKKDDVMCKGYVQCQGSGKKECCDKSDPTGLCGKGGRPPCYDFEYTKDVCDTDYSFCIKDNKTYCCKQ